MADAWTAPESGTLPGLLDTRLAAELVDYVGLQLRAIESTYPFHIAAVATRLEAGAQPDNTEFLRADAAYRSKSPFDSDHLVRHSR